MLKRENQICQSCNNPIRDEDIEFDHFIPHSKGGSSDEHNVVLLCKRCNRKKGSKFEDTYLVDSVLDHTREPQDTGLIKLLKTALKFNHEFLKKNGRDPEALDYTKLTGSRKPDLIENTLASVASDMRLFFTSKRPAEIPETIFHALGTRWGFTDGLVYKLSRIAADSQVPIDDLIKVESDLVFRLGWLIPRTSSNLSKWKLL